MTGGRYEGKAVREGPGPTAPGAGCPDEADRRVAWRFSGQHPSLDVGHRPLRGTARQEPATGGADPQCGLGREASGGSAGLSGGGAHARSSERSAPPGRLHALLGGGDQVAQYRRHRPTRTFTLSGSFANSARTTFDIAPEDFRMTVNVYLTNGLSIEQIERYWLNALDLPATCVRKHIIDFKPTSSSGQKRNKLPYGVLQLAAGQHPDRATHLRRHSGVRRVRRAAVVGLRAAPVERARRRQSPDVCSKIAGGTTTSHTRRGSSWPVCSRATRRAVGMSLASATPLP